MLHKRESFDLTVGRDRPPVDLLRPVTPLAVKVNPAGFRPHFGTVLRVRLKVTVVHRIVRTVRVVESRLGERKDLDDLILSPSTCLQTASLRRFCPVGCRNGADNPGCPSG